MPAFNFLYITPPPLDEVVNEQTQINGNLNQIENRLNGAQGLAIWPNVDRPKGLEVFILDAGERRTAVWNGTAYRFPDSIQTGWTAWANVLMVAPYQATSAANTPQWRSHPLLRQAQLRGKFRNGATGVPMAKNAWTNFSAGVGGIPTSFDPLADASLSVVSTSPITGASPVGSEIAAARIRVNSDVTSVRLDFNWMGQDSAATGNYICLDGVEWWY